MNKRFVIPVIPVVLVVLVVLSSLGGAAPPALAQSSRAPDATTARTASLAIVDSFMATPEARSAGQKLRKPAAAQRAVNRLFEAFLERRPSRLELREGQTYLARTGDVETIVEAIVGSREYAQRGADPLHTVVALHQGVLGRTPGRDEVDRWLRRVDGDAQPSASARASTAERRSGSRRVDSTVTERLKTVMVPLLKAMDRPIPLDKVRVGVLDDRAINAANAGGGEFYVTVGLLEQASDDGLRGVMAHEVAHADLGHVAKLKRLGLGLNIGAIILDQIVPGAGSIAPIAGQLIANAYTRKEEYEADAHGAKILERAGYDGPGVMVDTLTWLQQKSGDGGGGFFATHPATGDRIEAVRNLRAARR